MIVGSIDPLPLGVPDVGRGRGIDERWRGQPYVPLREATYAEYESEHPNSKWTLQSMCAFYSKERMYFYEVSTD